MWKKSPASFVNKARALLVSSFLLLLVVVAPPVAMAQQAAETASTTRCVLSDPVALDANGLVQLQHFVNEEEGTYTMKITYYGGRSYIGIGVNQDGSPLMVPSVATIGRNDGEDGPRVMEYTLTATAGVQPATLQDGILTSTFEQTETTSTLTFTQLLNEPDQVAITDATQWIYAIGFPDNQWMGHAIRGSFQLPLSRTCGSSTGLLPCPLSAALALDAAGDLELEHFVDYESSSFTMRLSYYGGEAWIGLGINSDGIPKMTPATVVIGRGDEGFAGVQQYRMTAETGVQVGEDALQDLLLNATFVQSDGVSVLTFTQQLDDGISDSTQWIYAVGFPENNWMGHGIQGGFLLALSPTCDTGSTSSGAQAAGTILITDISSPNRVLWMTHGVLMGLAWGLLAPLAIAAAVLRGAFERVGGPKHKGTWFQVHMILNVLVLFFTIAGFIVAVVAKNEQSIDGVKAVKSTHGKMGFAILVFVAVQCIAAQFRPALPKSTDHKTVDESSNLERSDNLERTERSNTNNGNNSTTALEELKVEEVKAKKSYLRLGWEVFHRLTAVALLAMAWYNCHTGIQWSAIILEDYNDWSGAFWGVVGGIFAAMTIGEIFLEATAAAST